MPVPTTFKPWIEGRGQPIMITDPQGNFVHKEDYEALERDLLSVTAALEVAPTPTAEEDDAKS